MAKKRDTYKYYFKVGNKIVYGGISQDLERREQEHLQKWPKGHIVQVGRRTTEEAAKKWERDMIRESRVKSPLVSGSRKPIEYKKAARKEASRKTTDWKGTHHKKSTLRD